MGERKRGAEWERERGRGRESKSEREGERISHAKWRVDRFAVDSFFQERRSLGTSPM